MAARMFPRNRMRDDGVGEDCPMLEGETGTRKGQNPRSGPQERGTAWRLLLAFFCCISLFAISEVMLWPFFIEFTASHSPASTQTPGDSDSGNARVSLTQAEQLDLKTGFVVSNLPKVREYIFNITMGRAAPDGHEKLMILINGQSPGPLVEANTGDVIRVVVNNQMPEASTTIHWHSIDQRNTTWMDGVDGLSQCGIPHGQSFTYEFNVTGQRGTFWYHSHVSVQYTNGLYGPLIIHDPDEKIPVVTGDKIIMFGDLFHRDAEEVLLDVLHGDTPLRSNCLCSSLSST